MDSKEIKAVFDRTFNGMPNPIFCHPISYFEYNGYLCELASSASSLEMARTIDKDWGKQRMPLSIFKMMFAEQGLYLTVLTKNGELTEFNTHINSKEELEKYKASIV